MKPATHILLLAVIATTTLASCEVIGDIFKAGFWTAIILIVLVVALLIWLVGRFRR